jgi:hypothetical protein
MLFSSAGQKTTKGGSFNIFLKHCHGSMGRYHVRDKIGKSRLLITVNAVFNFTLTHFISMGGGESCLMVNRDCPFNYC